MNQRHHKQALFIYMALHILAYMKMTDAENFIKENPDNHPDMESQYLIYKTEEQATKDIQECINDIKMMETDNAKRINSMRGAFGLSKKLYEPHANQGFDVLLIATKMLFDKLIANGFEIYKEGDFSKILIDEWLPDRSVIVNYYKKEPIAQKIADEWLNKLHKEGYFV